MKESLTMQRATRAAKDELSAFRAYEAFPRSCRKEIYKILINDFGVDIDRSILVSYLPEGGRNLGITLIDQNGNICFFDIDPDAPEFNDVERDSIDDYEKSHDFKKLKPWHELVLGIKLYREQIQ